MVVEEKLGAAKRFGARYGKRVKDKFIKIEQLHREKKQCPYCNKIAVKRVAVGIWQCRKCGVKFTGKAYNIAKKIIIKEKVTEVNPGGEIPEKIEEETDEETEEDLKKPVKREVEEKNG